MVDLKDLEFGDDAEDEGESGQRRRIPLDDAVRRSLGTLSHSLALTPGSMLDRGLWNEIEAARSVIDQLNPDDLQSAVAQVQGADLSTLTSVASHLSIGHHPTATAVEALSPWAEYAGLLSGPTPDVARQIESLLAPASHLLEDIKLAEGLLATFEPPEGIGESAASSLAVLSADLGRTSGLVRHLLDDYLIPRDRFELRVRELGSVEVERLVQETELVLKSEVHRRGWNFTPVSSEAQTTRHPVSERGEKDESVPVDGPAMPDELQAVLADATPEQAGALRRVWAVLGTSAANTLSNILLLVVTAIAIATSPGGNGGEAGTGARGGVPIDDAGIHDGAGTPDPASAAISFLDLFEDDDRLQDEIVRYLHGDWSRSGAAAVRYQEERHAADRLALMSSVEMLDAQALIASARLSAVSSARDPAQALERLRSRGEVLGVDTEEGEWLYPIDQFDARGGVAEPIVDVMSRAAAQDYTPWEVLYWLATPQVVSEAEVEPGRPIEGISDDLTLDELVACVMDRVEPAPAPRMESLFALLARGETEAFRTVADRWLG